MHDIIFSYIYPCNPPPSDLPRGRRGDAPWARGAEARIVVASLQLPADHQDPGGGQGVGHAEAAVQPLLAVSFKMYVSVYESIYRWLWFCRSYLSFLSSSWLIGYAYVLYVFSLFALCVSPRTCRGRRSASPRRYRRHPRWRSRSRPSWVPWAPRRSRRRGRPRRRAARPRTSRRRSGRGRPRAALLA